MNTKQLVDKVIIPDELARVFSDETYFAPFPPEFEGCLIEASPNAPDVTELVQRAVANALGEQLFQIKTAIHAETAAASMRHRLALSPSDEKTIHAAQINAYNKVMGILIHQLYKPENAGKGVTDAEF